MTEFPPSLYTIDKKLEVLIQRFDDFVKEAESCENDHESRIRVLEENTVRLGVIFGSGSLLAILTGVIALIRSFLN